MKSSRCLLLSGALLIVLCAVVSVNGRGGGKKFMEMFKKCGDGEINVEEAFKGKKECMQEMQAAKGNERRKRSPSEDEEGGGGRKKGKRGRGRGMHKKHMCAMVCQWKKAGMLDESGKYSESGAEAYVDRVYPEKLRADMKSKLKECNTENGSKFSMDDNCGGYKDFKRCMMQGHMKTCGIKMGQMGKGKGKGGKPPPPPPEDDDE